MIEQLISVIIPIYNVEPYLKRCVDSVRQQTYSNLEIILVDDGSPDRCGIMCDEFALQDSRIRVIHKENGGLASARNAGLDIAAGEYVGFVDSDDYIAPNMFAQLQKLMQKYGAQICCCGIQRVDDRGHLSYFNEKTDDFLVLTGRQALRELVANYRITSSVCDKLYTKDIFSGCRMTEGMIYEDYDIMHRLLYAAQCIVYTGAPMYCYYQSSGSIIRKEFNPKRFDEMVAEQRRLAFYREHSPENVDVETARYLETGLAILLQSKGVKQCCKQREELRKDLLSFAQANKNLTLPIKTAQKLKILKLGLGFYDMTLNIAAVIRKIAG